MEKETAFADDTPEGRTSMSDSSEDTGMKRKIDF
jgi:hypothetical protein